MASAEISASEVAPGARHDGVGRGQSLPHAILVAQKVPAARLVIRERQRLGHRIQLLGARDVHDVQIRAREQLVFQGDDGLVDVARAQRPAEDEQHEIILGKVEHRPGPRRDRPR